MLSMIRKSFQVGPLQVNCVILADESTREAVVVDPGGNADLILDTLTRDELKPAAILHTHAHVDHMGGSARLARVTGAKSYLHTDDRPLVEILPMQAAMIGLTPPEVPAIDSWLKDGSTIDFGRHRIEVLHTPGHSPGSVCFSLPAERLCLTGDTLFEGGVGRTDLWGGDSRALFRSIRERLYVLDEATIVIPGHGANTTIGAERRDNPFVRVP